MPNNSLKIVDLLREADPCGGQCVYLIIQITSKKKEIPPTYIMENGNGGIFLSLLSQQNLRQDGQMYLYKPFDDKPGLEILVKDIQFLYSFKCSEHESDSAVLLVNIDLEKALLLEANQYFAEEMLNIIKQNASELDPDLDYETFLQEFKHVNSIQSVQSVLRNQKVVPVITNTDKANNVQQTVTSKQPESSSYYLYIDSAISYWGHIYDDHDQRLLQFDELKTNKPFFCKNNLEDKIYFKLKYDSANKYFVKVDSLFYIFDIDFETDESKKYNYQYGLNLIGTNVYQIQILQTEENKKSGLDWYSYIYATYFASQSKDSYAKELFAYYLLRWIRSKKIDLEFLFLHLMAINVLTAKDIETKFGSVVNEYQMIQKDVKQAVLTFDSLLKFLRSDGFVAKIKEVAPLKRRVVTPLVVKSNSGVENQLDKKQFELNKIKASDHCVIIIPEVTFRDINIYTKYSGDNAISQYLFRIISDLNKVNISSFLLATRKDGNFFVRVDYNTKTKEFTLGCDETKLIPIYYVIFSNENSKYELGLNLTSGILQEVKIVATKTEEVSVYKLLRKFYKKHFETLITDNSKDSINYTIQSLLLNSNDETILSLVNFIILFVIYDLITYDDINSYLIKYIKTDDKLLPEVVIDYKTVETFMNANIFSDNFDSTKLLRRYDGDLNVISDANSQKDLSSSMSSTGVKEVSLLRQKLDINLKNTGLNIQNSHLLSDKAIKQILALYKKSQDNVKASSGKSSYTQAIETIESLPFGTLTTDNSLLKIDKFLDKNIYGFKKAKEKIMRILAQKVLGHKTFVRPICLIGEPGVGKTFFAQRLGEALNRKIWFISASDMLSGQYIKGSIPYWSDSGYGEITKALILEEVMNPMIIIDEIDKIKSNVTGGQQTLINAFLEIFDPNQNNQFADNFTQVNMDLSQIIFICTANNYDHILPALRDRMDFIYIHNYTGVEKMIILDKFLIPKYIDVLETNGIKIVFQREAKKHLINLCPESGIRQLEARISDLAGAVSLDIIRKNSEHINKSNKLIITSKLIDTYFSLIDNYTANKKIGF